MLQYILALVTILIFVVLFIRKPQVETYVLYVLIMLPLMDTKILPLAYGHVKTFDVITMMALLFLVKEFLSFPARMKRTTFIILIVLFVILTLISGLHAEFGFNSYFNYYPIFTIFVFTRFLFVFSGEHTEKQYLAINAFKKGYIIALVVMAAQLVIGLQVSYYGGVGLNVLNEESGITRYPGVFAESQFNGQFLAMGSFVFLIIKKNLSQKKRYLNYLGFALSILFLFLAGSRSAMGGFLMGVLFLFLISSIRVKIYGFLVALLTLSSLAIISPDNGILSRTGDLSNDLDFRQSIWEETYGVINEHPLLGIGLGNFQEYTLKYYQNLYLEISPGELLYFTQPENGYLKILVEQGGLAFAIFCLFFIIPLANFAKRLYDGTASYVTYFVVASLISWLTAMNTVYSLSDYRILLAVATFLTFVIIKNQHIEKVKNKEILFKKSNIIL